MAESYLSRGVSPTKDDVKKAVANQDKGAFPGAFCKLIDDLAGDPDYCTAIHADGAGTKSSVAYIAYRETGDLKWFRGIAQDSLVMNTDDLACVGALEKLSLSNTIGRNAHRVDGKCIAAVIEGYNDIVSKLQNMGFDISMCGGNNARRRKGARDRPEDHGVEDRSGTLFRGRDNRHNRLHRRLQPHDSVFDRYAGGEERIIKNRLKID